MTNEEVLDAVVAALYEKCDDCGGDGLAREAPIFSCSSCCGSGKKTSWSGKMLLEFIENNLKLKVTIGR